MTESVDASALTRPDDDDHDLLTFGEAGVRLQEEILTTRAQIADLEQGAERDPATAAELAKAQARLDALQDAAARNARQPINDDNFFTFFGYEGKARRNTTW
jgi:hypothetical protein